MILTKKQLRDVIHGWDDKLSAEVGMTVSDQIAIEQLKVLLAIRDGITFIVVVIIIGIVLSLIR